jgi:hypothetical protein
MSKKILLYWFGLSLITNFASAQNRKIINEKYDQFYRQQLSDLYNNIQNKKEDASVSELLIKRVVLQQISQFSLDRKAFDQVYCSKLCNEYGTPQIKKNDDKAEINAINDCSQKCNDIQIEKIAFMKGFDAGTSVVKANECIDAVNSQNRNNKKIIELQKALKELRSVEAK